MPVKVNIVLDDDVKGELDRLIESGLRSKVINRALRDELLRIKRSRLAAELESLRQQTNEVPTHEITAMLRRDRRRK